MRGSLVRFLLSAPARRSSGPSSLWAAICVAGWYAGGADLGARFGFGPADAELAIAVSRFWSGPFLWFYVYFAVAVGALRRLLADRRAAPVVALVDPRLGAAALHHLLSGPGLGRDQRLVRAVLRHDPGGAGKSRDGTVGEFFGYIRELPRDRPRRGDGHRPHPLLRQPLRVPLADGDERLLHGPLAEAPAHRGRLAARAGRHHALRIDDREPRGQPARRADDADRLPAGPRRPLGQHHRAADPRRDPLPACGRGAAVVGLRYWRPRHRRDQAPGARVPQPACRGRLPQGARLRRGRRRARRSADDRGQLFSNLRRNYFRLYFHYVYFNVPGISTSRPTTSFPTSSSPRRSSSGQSPSAR